MIASINFRHKFCGAIWSNNWKLKSEEFHFGGSMSPRLDEISYRMKLINNRASIHANKIIFFTLSRLKFPTDFSKKLALNQ